MRAELRGWVRLSHLCSEAIVGGVQHLVDERSHGRVRVPGLVMLAPGVHDLRGAASFKPTLCLLSAIQAGKGPWGIPRLCAGPNNAGIGTTGGCRSWLLCLALAVLVACSPTAAINKRWNDGQWTGT